MNNFHVPQLWALTLILLHNPSNSLQLQHSWRTASSSQTILAVAQVTIFNNKATEHFLATTAGHKDGGTVQFWYWPGLGERDSTIEATGMGMDLDMVAATKPHEGSIFALTAWKDYLLSGSFDRSATLQRFSKGTSGDFIDMYSSRRAGTLTDHTGWVRDVVIVPDDDNNESDSGDNRLFLLSIGCNFINVWSCNNDGESRRLARLDAGPSPGDDTNELFRRHDILCMDVSNNRKIIVAGLVDGTLRAFASEWYLWKERNVEFDATGNCQMSNNGSDKPPCAAIRGHEGRITGVHAIPGCHDQFISTGYDAHWRHWKLDSLKHEFVMLAEGEVGVEPNIREDTTANERRIRCSVLVSTPSGQTSLVLGTTGGRIYRVYVYSGSTKVNVECKEIWREPCKDVSITAITCMAINLGDTSKSGDTIFAGTSDGFVRVFTD